MKTCFALTVNQENANKSYNDVIFPPIRLAHTQMGKLRAVGKQVSWSVLRG